MTVLLDAFAVIALLANEPAAALVDQEMRRPGADVRVTAVNVAEVYDQLVRVAGSAVDAVDSSLELLAVAGLEVITVDDEMARHAGMLRARHYQRGRIDVSLADCIALAASISIRATLATADPALAATARKERVQVIALPDSEGRQP